MTILPYEASLHFSFVYTGSRLNYAYSWKIMCASDKQIFLHVCESHVVGAEIMTIFAEEVRRLTASKWGQCDEISVIVLGLEFGFKQLKNISWFFLFP